MFERLGVRWRLLLAFFGISAFAVIAAAAAMYSFAEVGKLLGRITEERVPPALASLELRARPSVSSPRHRPSSPPPRASGIGMSRKRSPPRSTVSASCSTISRAAHSLQGR